MTTSTTDNSNSPAPRSRLRTRTRTRRRTETETQTEMQTGTETAASPSSSPSSPIELIYNPKLDGYLIILLASLVNFASISDISVAVLSLSRISLKDEKVIAIFGAVSFLLCFIIILFDRIRYLHQRFDFKEIWEGKLEGYTLLFLVLWWIVGVAIATKADGIAYRALNTYFSSWYALFMSVYTLNQWTSAKDILSIHELTRLSDTLPYWYGLFLCSLIEMGSAADVYVHLGQMETYLEKYQLIRMGKADYAIAVGAITAPIALCAILAHYKLLCCGCEKVRPHGGVTELSFALLLFVWWIVAVSLLTADDAIASTIQGGPIPIPGNEGSTASTMHGDTRKSIRMLVEHEHEYDDVGASGLNVTNMTDANANVTTLCECWNQTNTTLLPNEDENGTSSPILFPGNNLFLALWLGLYCSAKICLKWKAARAMVQMSDAMRRDAEACEDLVGGGASGSGSGGLVAAANAKSGSHRRGRDNEDDVD
eukprot:CAMPEP_0204636432 /NCGR_PEP_ID=MMETSP0717-20131115/33933_1 /ASSEMBLY_ACC=CAM_ASM_000666 /TAXON_ID=230516 /ORGANISM="Chaetoceros curvisetus" /LENGTH=482 /DNA_ID=CAMNT_0051655467 /DNA_START=180 /DNA_END=1628 /DNA_ORIENTATION=+